MPPKYLIIHPSGFAPQAFKYIGHANSLLEARKLREVSGDIVVDATTRKIIPNKAWLWQWERDDPTTFAHRLILAATATDKGKE